MPIYPLQVPNCAVFLPHPENDKTKYVPSYEYVLWRDRWSKIVTDRATTKSKLDMRSPYQRHLLYTTVNSLEDEYARLKSVHGNEPVFALWPTSEDFEKAIEEEVEIMGGKEPLFEGEKEFMDSPEVKTPETAKLDSVDVEVAGLLHALTGWVFGSSADCYSVFNTGA